MDPATLERLFADDRGLHVPRGAEARARRGLAARFAGIPGVRYGEDRRGSRRLDVAADGHRRGARAEPRAGRR